MRPYIRPTTVCVFAQHPDAVVESPASNDRARLHVHVADRDTHMYMPLSLTSDRLRSETHDQVKRRKKHEKVESIHLYLSHPVTTIILNDMSLSL